MITPTFDPADVRRIEYDTTWADLFEKSVELEETLNRRRERLGKDHVYLTRFGIPLREAVDTDQELIPWSDDVNGSCDSGWCFT